MPERLLWLDILKGLGILLVIMGHIPNLPFGYKVFYFHMPLFFIIAGYTCSNRNKIISYIIKVTKRLIVPYIIFLLTANYLLIDTPYSLKTLFIGGEGLYGELGVAWFITVLYLSVILLRIVAQRPKMVVLTGFIAIIISYYFIPDHPYFYIWNLRTVPFAYAFLCIGYLTKTIGWPIYREKEQLVPIALILLLAICLIPNLSMDIKHGLYGIHWISIITSTIQVLCLAIISMYIEKHFKYKNVLSYLGQHSFALMLIHMPVICYCNRLSNTNIESFYLLVIVLIISISILQITNCVKKYLLKIINKDEYNRKN